MAVRQGVVRWFNNAKGYGFLGCTSEADVFCHYTAIEGEGYKSLSEGERVEFDIEDGPAGRPQAARVRKVDELAQHAHQSLSQSTSLAKAQTAS